MKAGETHVPTQLPAETARSRQLLSGIRIRAQRVMSRERRRRGRRAKRCACCFAHGNAHMLMPLCSAREADVIQPAEGQRLEREET